MTASSKFLRSAIFGFSLTAGLVVAGTSPAAWSQADTGQIAGTVSDPSGATIANATVTVKNDGTGATRTEKSSQSGTYLVVGLTPGSYTVTTEAANFKSTVSKVEVTVGGHATLDAKLTVGSGTTEVQVIAEGGVEVNTQTQELSQVVDRTQLASLPSLTRNPYDFVALSGNISSGDSTTAGNNVNATTRGVGFNINGQRSTGTEILLDGVENIAVFGDGVGIKVPIDAVQEFRVVTSNFTPEYGRASGGVVNVTTRAGSNGFHGDLWEYNRLAAYTSNTVLNSQAGNPKGQYTRNQFGFVVGGPIVKDKLFFLGSTEWTRVRSAASQQSAVPTPQYLAAAPANIQNYFAQYGGGKTFNFNKVYTNSDIGSPITTLPGSTPIFGVAPFTAPGDAGGGAPQNTYNIVGR